MNKLHIMFLCKTINHDFISVEFLIYESKITVIIKYTPKNKIYKLVV